jgi:head-tail adaptor
MKPSLNNPFPAINPGEFRHQVSLLVPVTTQDGSGSVVTYELANPAISAWVKIVYVRGDEIFKSGQDVSQSIVKLTGWYRPEFTVTTRVQLPDGNPVIIQYLENVNLMNTYMVLTCMGIGTNS